MTEYLNTQDLHQLTGYARPVKQLAWLQAHWAQANLLFHTGQVPQALALADHCLAGWAERAARAGGAPARGLLLQALPAEHLKDPEDRAANWQHLTTLADTLSAEEMLGLDNETVLHRLYHEERVRLFEPQALEFRCSCSRERSLNALSSLGQQDAEELLKENAGEVVIDCQFCNQRYAFDAADIAQLFAGGGSQQASSTRH